MTECATTPASPHHTAPPPTKFSLPHAHSPVKMAANSPHLFTARLMKPHLCRAIALALLCLLPLVTNALGGEAADAYNEGVELKKSSQYREAIAKFDRAIELYPAGSDRNKANAYGQRAICFRQLSQRDKAIEDWTQAIRWDPGNPNYYALRGDDYQSLGKTPQALADWNAATRITPRDANGFQGRAFAYNRLDQPERALDDYTESIRQGNQDSSVYSARGLAYNKLHSYERAIEDFDTAIR